MPGHVPYLDRAGLQRLRGFVRKLHEQRVSSVPHETILQLANDVQLDGGVTIDFEASGELGQPLVVLRVPTGDGPAPCLDVLSKREREIAALIAEGLSNKQIGRRLFISLATVKDHVHRILTKTLLPNRAAVAAAQKGAVPRSPAASS